MNPHLFSAPAEDVNRPLESRRGDGDVSVVTGLTAQQASDLLAAHRCGVRQTQTWRDRWVHSRLARHRARQRYWGAVTGRSDAALERTRNDLAATAAVRRPYGRVGAFMVTALLMFASFLTISSILASADLAPLEAWLLPLAFGPVFVLATEIAVGAWLSSAPADRLPSPTHRVTSWIILPWLACAALALVSGVAVKSVAVGALVPLPEQASRLSSMLMFSGLALGELAGAAALAARQHRPGARAYAAARNQHRWTVFVHEFAYARLRAAECRVDAAEYALAAHQEWKAGRARLALASGWARAVRHSQDGDPLLGKVEISRVSIAEP